MKTLIYSIICVLLSFLPACQSKTTSASNTIEGGVGMDSIQKMQIDSLIGQTVVALRDSLVTNKIPYPLYTVEDTIYYMFTDDYSGRISIELEPDGNVNWPLFFIYKGELIKVRFRQAINDPTKTRMASECNVYLNKGHIVYCEERGRNLAEGEGPGIIRQLTHAPSKRSAAEIKADYQETWEKVLEILIQHDPKLKVLKS